MGTKSSVDAHITRSTTGISPKRFVSLNDLTWCGCGANCGVLVLTSSIYSPNILRNFWRFLSSRRCFSSSSIIQMSFCYYLTLNCCLFITFDSDQRRYRPPVKGTWLNKGKGHSFELWLSLISVVTVDVFVKRFGKVSGPSKWDSLVCVCETSFFWMFVKRPKNLLSFTVSTCEGWIWREGCRSNVGSGAVPTNKNTLETQFVSWLTNGKRERVFVYVCVCTV